MKKLLFLLFFVTSFNAAIAQSVFNEDDLIGTWVNVNQNASPKTITFYGCHDYSGYFGCLNRSPNTNGIRDYFISPSNKLHIYNETRCNVYIIISLTSDKMVLLDKGISKNADFYTIEYEFYKEEDVSAINEISNETTDSDKIYNLKGQLLENEPDSGVYIQNGKKYVKK